jgi:hypothetical protein
MRSMRQTPDSRSVSEPQTVDALQDRDEILFPLEGLINAEAGWMRTALIVAGISSAFGLAAIALYALQAPNRATVVASGVLFAGAAVVAGGFIGFLFGLPHTIEVQTPGTEEGASVQSGIVANTNLEQISDWLTKILVGVTLTQLGAIRSGAVRLFNSMAPALGGQPDSAAFAGGIVVYFSVLGFLVGWLLTRLRLGQELSRTDQALKEANDNFRKADAQVYEGNLSVGQQLRRQGFARLAGAAVARGNLTAAYHLRQEASTPIDEVTPIAKQYEDLRTRLPSGPARTIELERLVSNARQRAPESSITRRQCRDLFVDGDEGSRITALGFMQGKTDLADIDVVLEAITNSRSGFEQYHGLELARRLLPNLKDPERRRLTSAIRQQRERGWIKPGTDRWSLSEDILNKIRLDEEPATAE